MSAAAGIEARVRATGLLARDRPVLVLVSGGRDSVCLLDLAVTIAGAGAVRALHVHYGLRPAADGDAAHCAALCERLGVKLAVHRPTRGPHDGNVQAWARRERYAAARELAGDADVAAGHTGTDQVETILYRLASSPSRRALYGMRPRAGTLVRPLLGVTRAQTAAHCRARGLDWREDESNASDAYARGRVRHELVPALERVHPGAVANVLALAELLAAEGAVLDELVDGALATDPAHPGKSAPAVSLATLRAQPPALRRLIVQRLADAAVGRPAAGVSRRAGDVCALPERGVAALDLPSGVRATARAGVVRFAPTPPLRRRAAGELGDAGGEPYTCDQ